MNGEQDCFCSVLLWPPQKANPAIPQRGMLSLLRSNTVKYYIIMKNSSLRQVRLPEFCALR
jgi:hypothetical protein